MNRGLSPLLLTPLLLAILTAGCASVISKELKSQVKPDLRFERVRENPEGLQGKKVLFGGLIIKALVKRDHTLIEVLEKPLGFRDKPKDTDTSGGRFLVLMDGYKDPAIYSKGKRITVFGEVLGKRILKLDELEYGYPLIRSEEHYLWKQQEVIGPRFHFGFGFYQRF